MLRLSTDGKTLLLGTGRNTQPVTFFKPGKVMLALDTSGSMCGNLDQAKREALKFSQKARTEGYMTGLVTFDDNATLRFRPQDVPLTERNFAEIEAGGGTDIADGLRVATNNLTGDEERAIVLVTDGFSDATSALEVAAGAKARGIRIICIGVEGADLDFLRQLASSEDLASLVRISDLESSLSNAVKALPPAAGLVRR